MGMVSPGGTLDGMTVAQLEELQQRVQASLTAAKAKRVIRAGSYEFDGMMLTIMSAQSRHANKTLQTFLQEVWRGLGHKDAKILGELLIAVADRNPF